MATKTANLPKRKAGGPFRPLGIDADGKLCWDEGTENSNNGNGLNGKDGAPGRDGTNGINGRDGSPGRDGINGRDGIDGKDGKDGINGRDGVDGKDGVNSASGGVAVHPTGGLYVGPDGKLGVDFSLFGKPIYGRTKAHIQAAITASTTPGERFLLFGEYDFSANPNDPLILNKDVELYGMNNCSFNGGEASGFLMKVNKIAKGAAVRNIKFVSQSLTSPLGLVYCNQEGDINNLTFDNCEFNGNPLGNYNAFGMNAWANDTNTGARFRNIVIHNCKATAGRMGYEILSHKWDGDPRITDFYFTNSKAIGCGTANTDNNNLHGMGLSLSGDIYGVTVTSPTFIDTLLGLEMIGTRRFAVSNPRIFCNRTVTTTDNVKRYGNGMSFTDGGHTGYSPKDGSITGGTINVNGRVLNTYYADDISFTGGNYVGGQFMQCQHGTGIRFHSVDLECLGSEFVARFENQKEILIEGGKWSRKNSTVAPRYEPVSFDGGCDGIVRGLDIRTNKSIRDGMADNYYDGAPYGKNYLYSDSPNVYWTGIYWNGKKQADNA